MTRAHLTISIFLNIEKALGSIVLDLEKAKGSM